MENRDSSPSVRPCEICGGDGNPELIATCIKCQSTREHFYCMKVVICPARDDWICELCQACEDTTAPQFCEHRDSIKQMKLVTSVTVHCDNVNTSSHVLKTFGCPNYSKRQKNLKAVPTGKVKYLSADEAIKLSSGTPREEPSRVHFSSKSMPVNSLSHKFLVQSTPTRPKASSPSFPSNNIQVNPQMLPTELQKAARHSNVNTGPMTNQQVPPLSPKEWTSHITPVETYSWRGQNVHPLKLTNETGAPRSIKEKAKDKSSNISPAFTRYQPAKTAGKMAHLGSPPTKELICEKKKLVGREKATEATYSKVPVKKVEAPIPNVQLQMSAKRPLNTALPSVGSGGTSHALAECDRSTVGQKDLRSFLPKLKLYHPYLPSLTATWKGGLRILYSTTIVYHGFQAQPPARVHRKAYELSCKMPPMLEMQLLPRHFLLSDLFHKGCPDLQEIGLYFFPSADVERSEENYGSLLERMDADKSMLRSSINGIKLLLFTSKQLTAESQEVVARQNSRYFLWGVFCH